MLQRGGVRRGGNQDVRAVADGLGAAIVGRAGDVDHGYVTRGVRHQIGMGHHHCRQRVPEEVATRFDRLGIVGQQRRDELGDRGRLFCFEPGDEFRGDRNVVGGIQRNEGDGDAGLEDEPGREYSVEDRNTLETRQVAPGVPFGAEWAPESGTRREQLATWVTHADNARFERANANSLWADDTYLNFESNNPRVVVMPQPGGAAEPAGRWNRVVQRVVGNRLTATLNGKVVVANEVQAGLPQTGRIALVPAGRKVEFANVFVKRLR